MLLYVFCFRPADLGCDFLDVTNFPDSDEWLFALKTQFFVESEKSNFFFYSVCPAFSGRIEMMTSKHVTIETESYFFSFLISAF